MTAIRWYRAKLENGGETKRAHAFVEGARECLCGRFKRRSGLPIARDWLRMIQALHPRRRMRCRVYLPRPCLSCSKASS